MSPEAEGMWCYFGDAFAGHKQVEPEGYLTKLLVSCHLEKIKVMKTKDFFFFLDGRVERWGN